MEPYLTARFVNGCGRGWGAAGAGDKDGGASAWNVARIAPGARSHSVVSDSQGPYRRTGAS